MSVCADDRQITLAGQSGSASRAPVLLRGSFIPPQPQRDLRELTRQHMNLVQDRVTVVNRLQKVLEWANIKLTSVATDVTGVSARAMLEAILQGQVDAQTLAELARGRMSSKLPDLEQALSGRVREHHRFLIANHLAQIDFLDEQIAVFDAEIAKRLEPPSEPPEGRIEQTDQKLKADADSTDGQLSWEYTKSFYHRLAGRRGVKRATVAGAHRILMAAYHMLIGHEPFHELGAAYLDERKRKAGIATAHRLPALGCSAL